MKPPAGPALIGLDLGTTVCRSYVFDGTLEVLGSASRHLPLVTLSGTEIEQSAEGWWDASVEVIRESLQAAGIPADCVKAISVSSQGISFVPVDRSCRPMRPALSWMDTRARAQRGRVTETLGDEAVFAVTGKRCNEGYALPKLLWLAENQAQVYESCHRILMPLDFITARLTGEYVTDHTMASGTMYYDVTRREWSHRILDAFALDAGKLPAVRQGGSAVGSLRPEAAEALGLPRGVVVCLGGQDQKVAALAAGIDLDRTTISLGTAMAIEQNSLSPVLDPGMRIPCFAGLLAGDWVLEGVAICCSILDWARNALFPAASYDELNRMAEEAESRPDAPFLLPFFSGELSPWYSPQSRGTLHGLDLSTTPGQIVRAVFEGIAFLVRANMEVMAEVSRPVAELRIFGGGSRSDTWCQVIADVTQRPLGTLKTSECAAAGAAILAGLGSGLYRDVREPQSHMRLRRSFPPRENRRSSYDERYARFQDLRVRLTANETRTEEAG